MNVMRDLDRQEEAEGLTPNLKALRQLIDEKKIQSASEFQALTYHKLRKDERAKWGRRVSYYLKPWILELILNKEEQHEKI